MHIDFEMETSDFPVEMQGVGTEGVKRKERTGTGSWQRDSDS